MFCPKCGVPNESDFAICVACGAELVDNQPKKTAFLEKVLQNIGQLPKKLKTLPKSVKRLSLIAAVLAVATIIFYLVGSAITDPENIAHGYFKAKAEGNWQKVFTYLSLQNSDFVNKDSFAKLFANERKLDVINFEIAEDISWSELGEISDFSTMKKTYTVSYLLRGSTEAHTDTITLIRKGGKKLLFFDDYFVNIEYLTITKDYQVRVPKDAAVYIDDVRLSQITENDQDDITNKYFSTYTISSIFSGLHDLKIDHPAFEEYTEMIDISEYNVLWNGSTYTLKDTEKSGIAQKTEETYKRIIAAALKDDGFDLLHLSFSNDSENTKGSYDRLISDLKSNDGTGFDSITVTKFSDHSNGRTMDSVKYSCTAEIEYEYSNFADNNSKK